MVSDPDLPPTEILNRLVCADAMLPSQVFRRRFAAYRFFDLDITTSPELAGALWGLLEAAGRPRDTVHVFSARSRAHVAALGLNDNWHNALLSVGCSLHDAGDCDGMILLPASGDWVVFQSRPVDCGVVAWDRPLAKDASGCFFDCADVAGWMRGSTARDIGMRVHHGELLAGLIAHYCADCGSQPD